jgi:hypothetical protein
MHKNISTLKRLCICEALIAWLVSATCITFPSLLNINNISLSTYDCLVLMLIFNLIEWLKYWNDGEYLLWWLKDYLWRHTIHNKLFLKYLSDLRINVVTIYLWIVFTKKSKKYIAWYSLVIHTLSTTQIWEFSSSMVHCTRRQIDL